MTLYCELRVHIHTHTLTHTHTHSHTHTLTHTHTHTLTHFNQLQAHEFEVIAMYNYAGQEQGDLALVKGTKYVVFDDSRQYWWRARDERG